MRIRKIIKRAFSVLLAGVMSVAVFTACGENDDKKSDETLSAKEMLLNVLDMETNSNLIAGIFSGEANAASKSDVTVEFKKGITDALGTEVKPLSFSSETKLKGSKCGTDIAVTYDGNNLISLNGVYDNKSEIVYIKVPELSDAYLSASSKDFKELRDSLISSAKTDLSALPKDLLSSTSAIKTLLKLKADEYEDIFKDYVKVVADAFPEASKEDKLSGKIDSVEYDYNIKTYTLTSDDTKKIAETIFEKIKNDEKIKEIAVNILGYAYELTDDNYASKVDELKNTLLEKLNSQTENLEVSLMYDGDDIVGIKNSQVTFACVDRKDVYAFGVESKGLNQSFTATKDGKKLDIDCKMNIDALDEGSKNFSAAISADDFEIVDKENRLVNGDYEISAQINDKTVKLKGTDRAEENKVNSDFNLSVNDVEYAKITVASEITNASDISVPNGTVYTLDQIKKYQSSMKLEELITNFKTVLGKDLMSALTSLGGGILTSTDGEAGSSADSADEEDAIMLEDYYNKDGSFNYDKLKEDLGEEEYEAFMSQINIEDLEFDSADIE